MLLGSNTIIQQNAARVAVRYRVTEVQTADLSDGDVALRAAALIGSTLIRQSRLQSGSIHSQMVLLYVLH